jgi:hypothetical protein
MSFCLVFFFSQGDVEGLLRALYMVPIYMDTHGFQIGVCLWGLGAGSAPGTLLPEDPFPAEGPGAWAGDSPSMAGKTTPPWALSPSGGNSGRGSSPRPAPSSSPCPQSGVAGER